MKYLRRASSVFLSSRSSRARRLDRVSLDIPRTIAACARISTVISLGMATKRLVKFRAKDKKTKQRLLRSPRQDFERWDAAARKLGITFTDFARRALDRAALGG